MNIFEKQNRISELWKMNIGKFMVIQILQQFHNFFYLDEIIINLSPWRLTLFEKKNPICDCSRSDKSLEQIR